MKKINKSVKFLLALSLFLSTGAPVSARTEIQYPTNETTIPVSTFIGDFDNTDPESPNPIDPDIGNDPNHPSWLNVTVPSTIAFTGIQVDEDSGHRLITSPEFTINNRSGRAVNVYINNFIGESTSIIQELSINKFLLIEEGSFIPLAETADERLFNNISANTEYIFEFSGTALNLETSVAPGFDLVLGFRVAGNYDTDADPVDVD